MSETDQPDLSQLQAQAEDAKQILASPVFNAAFDRTKLDIIQTLMNTPLEATETREKLHSMALYSDVFKKTIEAVVSSFESADVMQQQKAQQQGATTGAEEGGD